MDTVIRDWTGKNHKVVIEVASYSGDCGIDPNYRAIVARIDGLPTLRDHPVFNSHADLSSACFRMERAVEYYLDGKHHPTHYTGSLAHLARMA
jgi:hypothetical protein